MVMNLLRLWLFITTFYLQTTVVRGWSNGNNINGIIHRNQRQPFAIGSIIPHAIRTRMGISSNQRHSTSSSSLSSQCANNNDDDDDIGALEMSNFPEPLVWLWSPHDPQGAPTPPGEEWKAISEISLLPAAIRTWNWAKHFVLKLGLCPWAKASLDTPNSMQVFVVPKEQDIPYTTGTYANDICQTVADKCLQYCQDYPEKESSIIFFVVFQEEDEDADCVEDISRVAGFHDAYDQWESFIDFHEWFTDLEDDWDMDDIIVAPFHPNWQFGGDGQNTLDFEKKSPYPTVTFVSAKVVEQAGEAATAQIAQKNEETLQGKTLEYLEEKWDDSSSSSPSMPW